MKIILRPLHKNDRHALVALADNIRIWNNMRDRMPYPYKLQHADEFTRYSLSRNPLQTLAIEADGQFAGCIGIELNEDIYRFSVEIGYWIGEPFWGKGIASQALDQMLQHITHYFPQMVRVYAKVFEYNKASMRVLEKNGFILETVHKKSAVKNNQVVDEYLWVKLLP